MKTFNLNKNPLDIQALDYGATDCLIKLGRKLWRLRVDRHALGFLLELWDYKAKSKFGAPHFTFLQFQNYNKHIFERHFFEGMERIKEAHETLKAYDINQNDIF